MKKLLVGLELLDLILFLTSLYFHKDVLLFAAAIVTAVCIILTFSSTKKNR